MWWTDNFLSSLWLRQIRTFKLKIQIYKYCYTNHLIANAMLYTCKHLQVHPLLRFYLDDKKQVSRARVVKFDNEKSRPIIYMNFLKVHTFIQDLKYMVKINQHVSDSCNIFFLPRKYRLPLLVKLLSQHFINCHISLYLCILPI